MTGPRANGLTGRGKKTTPASKLHAPPKVAVEKHRTKNDEAREMLAEMGLNPIKMLAEIANNKDSPPMVKARALEQLLPFIMPREKPVSQELDELRQRLETQMRYVILGEAEDTSPEMWEARNAHWREWLAKRELALVPALVAVVEGETRQ